MQKVKYDLSVASPRYRFIQTPALFTVFQNRFPRIFAGPEIGPFLKLNELPTRMNYTISFGPTPEIVF